MKAGDIIKRALNLAIEWEESLAEANNVRDEECQKMRAAALQSAREMRRYRDKRFGKKITARAACV